MKYQLIAPVSPNYSSIEQVLVNRGIYDVRHYLNTTDADIASFKLFGEERLKRAAIALMTAIDNNWNCLNIIDSDCDGFTSSSFLINYLYDIFPHWTTNHLKWFMHEGKQHGLSDLTDNELEGISLVILPDAGSNDYKYHKALKEKGIEIIVLDHHDAEKESEDAIIINNQLSDYPNKHLSGVGVTWQFCRYLDSLLGIDNADRYLDLVALGNCADMMSMTSFETKHIINKGFKNITNPFFAAMVEKNTFSMKGKVNHMSVAFYIAPYINAIVRSGTMEEKQLIFKSMLNFEAFQMIPSNKRGHKLGDMEMLIDQALRTAVNVKNRQTKAQDAGMALIENLIIENNMMEHKVLLFLLNPGEIDRNIAGLCANKIMAKYQRPCCILTRVDEDGKISYQGSARGYDKGGVTDFKGICVATEAIMYAEGHPGAFGLGIEEDKINLFIERTDELLVHMSAEPIYLVDYIYKGVHVKGEDILNIAEMDDLWGKDVDEPWIVLEDVPVSKDMVTVYAKKDNTLKITLPNGISLMKFKASDEECEMFENNERVRINVVGRCNKNEWNGYVSPQLFIEEYDIISTNKHLF